LVSEITDFNYKNVVISGNESVYSSLKPVHVKQVKDVWMNVNKEHNIEYLIDATAHIGCDVMCATNTLNCKSRALEVNELTFDILEHNISTFGYSDRVKCIHANFLDFLEGYRGFGKCYIYFDPPWGGKQYIENEYINIGLVSNKGVYRDISDIVTECIVKGCQGVMCKLPKNINMEEFNKNTNSNKQVFEINDRDDLLSYYMVWNTPDVDVGPENKQLITPLVHT